MKKLLIPVLLALIIAGCSKDQVDQVVDMTQMGSSMVYSTVFNLMAEPDYFNGKTIKMQGAFMKLPGPSGEETWNVVVSDATQCCYTGMAFQYDFGGSIPEEDTILTVTGRLVTETLDSGISYSYLKASSVEY